MVRAALMLVASRGLFSLPHLTHSVNPILRSSACFAPSWHGLQRQAKLSRFQNSSALPLWGVLWSATRLAVSASHFPHIVQMNAASLSTCHLSFFQRAVPYHSRHGATLRLKADLPASSLGATSTGRIAVSLDGGAFSRAMHHLGPDALCYTERCAAAR